MENFILAKITEILGTHYLLINFFGSLFGAEETVFILAIFAMQGYFPLWVTYLSCFLGFIVSDIFWFTLGKSKFIGRIIERYRKKNNLKKIKNILRKLSKRSTFNKLLFTKFFYGFRVPTIVYLGNKKINFREFLYNDIAVVAIWAIIIVSIGAMAGKGLSIIMEVFEKVSLAITYFAVSTIAFFLILKYMKKLTSKMLISINGMNSFV